MTKFFKNQPVRSDTSGMGVVYHVSDTSVGVQFGQCVGTFDLDGRRAKGHPVDLHPLESGKIVLSEAQKQKLRDAHYSECYVKEIESILSEPEPPKYQPKANEPVCVKNKATCWVAAIFKRMDNGYYRTYGGVFDNTWDYCRPFSPDLVGKVTD